jgi:nucleoside-diphosphate-sugar epimerase
MNVLIIGATGYLGTAVDEALAARGHRVSGVARSDAAKAKLEARGTIAVSADASKPNTIQEAAGDHDAVVYVALVTDADPWTVDSNALKAVRKALAGSEKTFVYMSGAWVYGNTGDEPAAEDSVLSPPSLMVRRVEMERAMIDMTNVGIRAIVLRPGIVYGRGAGIPAMLVQSARENGRDNIVGDGKNRWATIEAGDLGTLAALALESGRPGRAYNAVGDDHFTVQAIAEAASRGAGKGGATNTVPADMLGGFGECLALDQVVSAARAKSDLGWAPAGPSILEDLERGSYAGATLSS